jgi:hypothetical protein
LESCDRAIAIRPDYVEALSCPGVVLYALERFDEPLARDNRALAVWPDFAVALTPTGRPSTCRASLFQFCC